MLLMSGSDIADDRHTGRYMARQYKPLAFASAAIAK